MKKYTLSALLVGTFISLSIVSAQVTGDTAPDQSSEGCTDLSYNLTYKKSKDANTNGEVTDLQYFLQDQGFLTAEPNGNFGPSTLRAVKSFQKKNGFITSGYVGPMTRAKIKEISCSQNSDTMSTNVNQETTSKKVCKGVGTTSEGWYDSTTNELIEYAKCTNNSVKPVACTMEYRTCADGSAMPRDADCKWREDKCVVKEVDKKEKSLVVSSTFYNFNYTQGEPIPSNYWLISGTVTNISKDTINVTVTVPNQPKWLNVGFSGHPMTLAQYQSGGFGVSVDPTGLTPGRYTTNYVFTGNFSESPISIPVTLTVSAPKITTTITSTLTPTAFVIDSPSVALSYDSSNKEVSLNAKAKVQVTAGDSDLILEKPSSSWSPYAEKARARFSIVAQDVVGHTASAPVSVEPEVSAVSDNGDAWVVKSRESRRFYVQGSFNVKQMFSGSYHAVPQLYMTSNLNIGNILNTKDGNSVTIVGETSPYISGVTDTNGYITITGARLNLSGNYLQIDGTGNSMVSKFNPTNSSITIKKSDFPLTSNLSVGFHSIKIINTQTGDSNDYGFNAEQVTVQTTPVEVHGPNYNAMSCSSPSKSGLSQGQVACYGIWDYGNEFGGDPDMCPPYGYSSSQIGCKVTTKACQSGQAVATRVVNPTSMDVNSNDIATFASNLKSTKEAVKQQIPTLWEYTCAGDITVEQSQAVVPTIDSFSVFPTQITSGQKVSLSWTSSNTNPYCGLSDTLGTLGSFAVKNNSNMEYSYSPTASTVYTLACTKGNSTVRKSVSVSVSGATTPPTVTVSASPSTVTSGQSSTITWSSTNASTCILGLGNSSTSGIAAGQVVIPTFPSTTYSVICTGNGGSVTKSVTVNVSPANVSTPPTVVFARTAGFVSQSISPNSTNVKIGSFTIQNSSNEYITIGTSTVNLVFSGDFTNNTISNLSLRNFGVPIGYVADTTNYFFSSIPVSVAPYGTQTFDVYADIGNATNGSVTAGMTVYYSGNTSHVSGNVNATGVSVTPVVSTLANPILVASSPASQFVIGGSSFGIATYRFATEGVGSQATLQELHFNVVGQDAIQSVTVNGVTSPVVGSGAVVSGLSIPVSSLGTDVSVVVMFNGFRNSTLGGALASGIKPAYIVLDYIGARSNSGSVITKNVSVSSNNMTLVASRPSLRMSSGGTESIALGATSKIGEFVVSANANGSIKMSQVSLIVNTSGITDAQISSPVIKDGNSTIVGANAVVNGSNINVSFGYPVEISAGMTKTFSVYATVNGLSQPGLTPKVTSSIASSASFHWIDVVGGGMEYTGVNSADFSSNSYSSMSTNGYVSQVLGAYSDNTKCVDIPRNMHRGAESLSVTTLQKFLQSKGLLTEVTGFYGDKTVEAVKDYQGSKGLPVTGMVYDATRESIKGETCQ